MKSKNKESLIILPNNEKCPAGKTKDELKLLSLISEEYRIEEDIAYFNIQKQKNKYWLKLMYIPLRSSDIYSVNAKKFVVFELIKNGMQNAVRIDEDLNKRASTILDLVNNTDPSSIETIRAKLSSILDVAGELEHILDLLLSNLQFNSFKYTVLNNSKTACLLCVNTTGICIRTLTDPYEIEENFLWTDIKNVTSKPKKLIIHKHDGQVKEINCLNKKIASLGYNHLRRYLEYMGSIPAPETTSWLGRISQSIRKSFSKRISTNSPSHLTPSLISEKNTLSRVMQEKSAAPSTVPENSFISEDVMDNAISMVEPSLKTNSTYDVSLGSDNSYRPILTSLSNEELSNNKDKHSSFQKPIRLLNDDHDSLKTTSTYEVSLDSRHADRPLSNDNDSFNATGSLSSFGTNPNLFIPPTLQIKKDVLPNEKNKTWTRSPITKTEEVISLNKEESPKSIPDQLQKSTSEQESGQSLNEKLTEKNETVISKQMQENPQNMKKELHESPIEPLQCNETLKEVSVRQVTEPCIKFVPEPPIRMNTEQLDNRLDKGKEDLKVNQTEILSISITKSVTNQDSNKTLSLISDSFKEETFEVTKQSFISTDNGCINNDISNTEITMKCNEIIKSGVESNQPLDPTCKDNIAENIVEEKFDCAQNQEEKRISSEKISITMTENSEIFDTSIRSSTSNNTDSTKSESKLPVSRKRSIPKIQRPSRVPITTATPQKENSNSLNTVKLALSPSDKENYQNESGSQVYDLAEDANRLGEKPNSNFSRFENQEYKVDSKTTFTSISKADDSIIRKSSQTEISSVKSTGIPTPKQYKLTTTITTVRKSADISKSPSTNTKIPTGIPRILSK